MSKYDIKSRSGERITISGAKDLINEMVDKMPAELLPYIGKLFQTIKNRQFSRRIKIIEDEFNNIYKIASKKDHQFFADKIGPVVLQNIFLDDEDDKAEFYVIGYGNCVSEEFKDEDRIIVLFDVVSELRMLDIKRLIYLYEYRTKKHDFEVPFDMKAYIRYVDEKLSRLGLIIKEFNEVSEDDTNLDTVIIKSIGVEVLKFIGHIS